MTLIICTECFPPIFLCKNSDNPGSEALVVVAGFTGPVILLPTSLPSVLSVLCVFTDNLVYALFHRPGVECAVLQTSPAKCK